MTVPIKLAHLCGPLGQALALIGEETWLFEDNERRRPTSNDIRFFFEHGLEVRIVDPSQDGALTVDNLSSILDLEVRCFQALQNLLVGMDAEIDDDLRIRNMRQVNRQLADHAVSDFVERRFLKPVVKEIWDLSGALRLACAEKLAAVERLYTIVDDTVLLQLEDEISIWASEQSDVSSERVVAVEN